MTVQPIQSARGLHVGVLIHRESRGGIVTDPQRAARRIFEAVPAEMRAAALVQALQMLIVHESRYAANRDFEAEQDRRHARTEVAPAPSWKVAAVRAEWQRRLDDSLVVGSRNVRLSDCTAEQLRIAADRYVELASMNRTTAARLLLWAEAVETQGVSRFGELPEERLKSLLGGAS